MSDEKPKQWCPDLCPITLRPFFMWINHPDHGEVPTYGGPFDSYTIPEPCNMPKEGSIERQDIEYHRHRYDHDAGGWSETELITLRVVDEELLIEKGVWRE